MPNSEIQVYIEKSSDGSTGWTKASGSFIDSKISIYNSNNTLIETQSINYYFTASYSTADTLYVIYNSGSITGNVNYSFMTWNINPKLNEPIISSYFYKLVTSAVNYTSIVFNPTGSNIPIQWELNVNNPNITSVLSFSPSNGKYWDYYPGYLNKLTLESIGGNWYYDKDLYQAQIPYSASYSSRFIGGVEPNDTQFPQVNDPWSLIEGDEIRFENDETKLYNITNIAWDTSISPNKLLITVDKDIPTTVNLNFFLIRRYKENKNNITINKTFPYSNQFLSSYSAPTTTGFIFPKYPVDKIAKNPDKIIRDLIDKKIIE